MTAPDGRVLYIGRGGAYSSQPVVTDWNNPDIGKGKGQIHVYDPGTKKVTLAGELTVFGNKGGGDELTKVEEGLLVLLGLQPTPAVGRAGAPAAAQVLTWTAGDDINKYTTAPQTAVAGPATIVFENSTATGNTTGMPHTLTFDVSDPEYNNDVPLNILANPNDDQGGRHTAEVALTPGRYRYYCTIPGHGQMQGILVMTEGSGEDTTAPETSASVSGTQNSQGAYVGSATVTVTEPTRAARVSSVSSTRSARRAPGSRTRLP